jgi:hypothetical protein
MLGCFAVVTRGVRMVLSADCLCCSAAFLDIGVFPLCLVARYTSTVDMNVTSAKAFLRRAIFPAQMRFQSRLILNSIRSSIAKKFRSSLWKPGRDV